MIDSISVAQTGLLGFERGLRNIANNTANINTPGFKGSTTQFADLFYGNNFVIGSGGGQFGYGLATLGTTFNFQQGMLQNTGKALDLAVDGDGFFTLRDVNGNIHYTKDGQFKFNSDGVLVSATTGEEVMALDGGSLVPISLDGLQTQPARATSTITFSGNLSSSATTDTINNVTVIDAAGTSHALSLTLTPVTGSAGSWTATLMDGFTTVGSGTIVFGANGQPVAGSNSISITYTPTGGTPVPLVLDFSQNVTSYSTGTTSTLSMANQNGYSVGSLVEKTFNASGVLVLTYSNGQKVNSRQLALGQFQSEDDVQAIGNNEYAVTQRAWTTGVAGSRNFGNIKAGYIEGSNVDLSQEFTTLVVMQRGYQACSQVVSTASEMLNTLYGMWGK